MALEKIYKNYPSLRPIATKAFLTTEIYELIAPYIFQKLYNLLSITDFQLYQVESFDSDSRLLKGFTVIERDMTSHEFLLGYDGQIYYNHEIIHLEKINNYINKLVLTLYECGAKKEYVNMKIIDRLKMEIEGVTLLDEQATIYLAENSLVADNEYNPSIPMQKKAIYQTALSVLQSIANNPATMKNYKQDDMNVSSFAKFLQNRINQLTNTIQSMPDTAEPTSFFNLFKN